MTPMEAALKITEMMAEFRDFCLFKVGITYQETVDVLTTHAASAAVGSGLSKAEFIEMAGQKYDRHEYSRRVKSGST